MKMYGKCPNCGRMEEESFADERHIQFHDWSKFKLCAGCGASKPKWKILVGHYSFTGIWWKPWTWRYAFVAANPGIKKG